MLSNSSPENDAQVHNKLVLQSTLLICFNILCDLLRKEKSEWAIVDAELDLKRRCGVLENHHMGLVDAKGVRNSVAHVICELPERKSTVADTLLQFFFFGIRTLWFYIKKGAICTTENKACK